MTDLEEGTAYFIFSEDGDRLAGPMFTREAAETSLRTARQHGEVDDGAYVGVDLDEDQEGAISMSEHVTRGMVERQLELFAKRIPLPEGRHWMLDYSEYGGYVVRIVNADTSQSEPFGPVRRNAEAMFDALRFAIVALDLAAAHQP